MSDDKDKQASDALNEIKQEGWEHQPISSRGIPEEVLSQLTTSGIARSLDDVPVSDLIHPEVLARLRAETGRETEPLFLAYRLELVPADLSEAQRQNLSALLVGDMGDFFATLAGMGLAIVRRQH